MALAPGLSAIEQPPTYEEDRRNATTAVVEVLFSGESLGIWLVSNVMDEERFPQQTFEHQGQTYSLALRFTRIYYPFSLHLETFVHKKYPGTDIPEEYSSHVRLIDPARGVDRPVQISMNEPLRYRGQTFFQASFSPDDTQSMLQVVDNPVAVLPYAAVALVGLGMTYHFALKFFSFNRKRRPRPSASAAAPFKE